MNDARSLPVQHHQRRGMKRACITDRQSMTIMQKGSCHAVITIPNWIGLGKINEVLANN